MGAGGIYIADLEGLGQTEHQVMVDCFSQLPILSFMGTFW